MQPASEKETNGEQDGRRLWCSPIKSDVAYDKRDKSVAEELDMILGYSSIDKPIMVLFNFSSALFSYSLLYCSIGSKLPKINLPKIDKSSDDRDLVWAWTYKNWEWNTEMKNTIQLATKSYNAISEKGTSYTIIKL